MGHTFVINHKGFSHDLSLEEGSIGEEVDVFCSTHDCYILCFEADRILFYEDSCLFKEEFASAYHKEEV